MRIVLDLQGAQSQSRYRGIGRYAMSLTRAVARIRGHHEVIVALSGLLPEHVDAIRVELASVLPADHVVVWHAPGPTREYAASNTWRRRAAEEIRESFLASLRPDVVHVFSMFEGFAEDVVASIGPLSSAFVTTVQLYDLIPMLNRADFLDPDPQFERHYIGKIEHLKRASAWLTISDASAREARTALGLPRAGVVNVSAACDESFRPVQLSAATAAGLLRRLGIDRGFVMYAGGAGPTKNLHRLVRAFACLPHDLRARRELVLVGRIPAHEVRDLRRTGSGAGLGKRDLVFTGFVDDTDLVSLYCLCDLFVLPSTHEGFGLPALEAMACGAPVIGSNVSSVPEVIGWTRALFDPLDEQSIAAKLGEALRDAGFRAELIKRGRERVGRFSWTTSAARAIDTFARLVGSTRSVRPVRSRTRQAIVRRLIDRIGRLDVGTPDDQDLLATARAIDLNLTEAAPFM
jgi:glycosyltransferase involved in cell wall biosynthesis